MADQIQPQNSAGAADDDLASTTSTAAGSSTGRDSTATADERDSTENSTKNETAVFNPNYHDPLEDSVVQAMEVGKNISDFTKKTLAGAEKFLAFVSFSEGEEDGDPPAQEAGDGDGAKPPEPDGDGQPPAQEAGDGDGVKPKPPTEQDGADKPKEIDPTAKQDEVKKPFFESTKPTEKELEWLKDTTTPEVIEKLKQEINKFGRDPREAILEAAGKTNILGLGEWHVSPNGLRTLAETMMPDFQKKGFTHLAVEIHHSNQDVLDRFAKGDEKAAQELKHMYGGLHDDSIAMMRAAVKSGLKLVAVDGNYPAPYADKPIIGGGPDELDPKELQARDNEMAKRISEIVEGDPKAKVLFVVGAHHLEGNDGGDDKYKSAANQLRERGKEKGYTITTFGAHMDQEHNQYFTTPVIAGSASDAVSVETAKTEELKKFPAATPKETKETLGRHDHAVFFPRTSALKTLEKEFGPDSERLLPALDSLSKFYFNQGDNKTAMEVMNRALKIEESKFGAESKEVALRLTEIAKRSEPEDALKHHIRSLAIREKLDGDKPTPEVMSTISDIIDLQFKTGNKADALKYFDKGSAKMINGKPDEQVTDTWSRNLYGTVRQFVEGGEKENAIHVLKHSIALDERRGDREDSLAGTHREIGALYEQLNKPDEAEKHLKTSLELARAFEKKNGITDDRIIEARETLGLFYDRHGRPKEATPLYLENLEMGKKERESYGGSVKLRALDRLLENSMAMKQDDKAKEHFNSAFELFEKGHSPYGIKQEEVFTRYTKYLEAQGKNDEAQIVRDRMKALEDKRKSEEDEFGFRRRR